jgi:hypothetical protein
MAEPRTDPRAEARKAPRDLPPNVTEFRARIDAGRTRERVPGVDAAAAPVGTEQEATGTHAGPAAAARPAPGSTPAADDSIAPDADPPPRGSFWFAVVAVVIALALVYLIWLARR